MVSRGDGRRGAVVPIHKNDNLKFKNKPKKQLGQNFLINDTIAKNSVAAAEIKPTDTIIEIGPGTGILTKELVKSGAKIFSIEKDFELIRTLEKNLGTPKNLKVIHQDALWFDLGNIPAGYKVVANIPYNITSPIIRKFLQNEKKPSIMILMLQKEVAQRIVAKAGNSDRGLLTIIVEFYSDAQILFDVSRREFYPAPKVDSALVKLKVKSRKYKTDINSEKFFKIVKAGFSSKRKQLHNSLAATLRLQKNIVIDILKKAEIDPTLRAEDLTLDDWLTLSRIF